MVSILNCVKVDRGPRGIHGDFPDRSERLWCDGGSGRGDWRSRAVDPASALNPLRLTAGPLLFGER